MEPRFGADFSRVRIHRDERAAIASRQLNAAAFTVGQHIHFGQGQWQPGSAAGRELIAHELTHTIQQGAASQGTANHIHRSELPAIAVSSPPAVQRLGIGDAWDFFARAAEAIPGFRLLGLALGRNPITQQAVDRTPANLLRAAVELIPGGAFITRALDNHGIIDRVAGWVAQQVGSVGQIAASIRQSIDRFLRSLSWSDIFDLGGVWERARQIVTVPIARITTFVSSLASGILQLIRDAILRPLAGLAQGTRGWDLLCAVLGRNPITGEAVPRTAENLIGGFMRLIGQEEVWQNLQRANAVNRAFAWFQSTLAGVAAFVANLPGLFMNTLRSLTINDLLTLPQTFGRVAGVFAGFAGSFISWGLNQVVGLLEILFSVVAPGVMPYIKKAQAAFVTIIRNPVGFVGNLVRAGKHGFQLFAGNILHHLKTALIQWLVGPLAEAGVYIPRSFHLMEIVKLVLSVLGLTWRNIRSKLVRIIPEPVLAGLERTAGILVTLVRDGPAAAWEQIKAELDELKGQLISQVTEMVSTEVVKAAVIRLVSMLNPAGAVIQAILAIYNTISFFTQRISQIAAVAASFVDSIAAIAAGQVTAAAKRVETTMASTLTVVIGFLARFAGLGNIPARLVAIVQRIRRPIDAGLDKIVAWLGRVLSRLAAGARNLANRALNWWRQRKSFRDNNNQTHNLFFEGEGRQARLMVASTKMEVAQAIALAASKASTNAERAAVSKAEAQKQRAETVIARLQSENANGYSVEDIDKINEVLNQLANAMKEVLPLISGGGIAASSLSVAVGELISFKSRHWIITEINTRNVKYKRLIPTIRVANAEFSSIREFDTSLKSGEIAKIDDKLTKRELYLGGTPSQTSDTGNRVVARMQRMNKYRVPEQQFLNARTGTWHSPAEADMGHVIDAVTWWNSNGRFKGPKAPEVLAFMNDADNYELELSSQNRSRGASSGIRYLPPAA